MSTLATAVTPAYSQPSVLRSPVPCRKANTKPVSRVSPHDQARPCCQSTMAPASTSARASQARTTDVGLAISPINTPCANKPTPATASGRPERAKNATRHRLASNVSEDHNTVTRRWAHAMARPTAMAPRLAHPNARGDSNQDSRARYTRKARPRQLTSTADSRDACAGSAPPCKALPQWRCTHASAHSRNSPAYACSKPCCVKSGSGSRAARWVNPANPAAHR